MTFGTGASSKASIKVSTSLDMVDRQLSIDFIKLVEEGQRVESDVQEAGVGFPETVACPGACSGILKREQD